MRTMESPYLNALALNATPPIQITANYAFL